MHKSDVMHAYTMVGLLKHEIIDRDMHMSVLSSNVERGDERYSGNVDAG